MKQIQNLGGNGEIVSRRLNWKSKASSHLVNKLRKYLANVFDECRYSFCICLFSIFTSSVSVNH